MEGYDIYNDIAQRTNGELFIGVVGPVRTGKSTFITKFMESFVIPNINNKLQKQIANDDMPQSADGKTVMTTQPKFIPANGVRVQFKNKTSANIRLIDCVGYMVDGATGHLEDDKPRYVKTPWSEKEIPFEQAADIGTKKVIEDYSTIGVLVTTDGSFGEIERKSFVPAEERCVKELKQLNKPFVIVLNTTNPEDDKCVELASDLEEKYQVPVIACSCNKLSADKISQIIEKVLLEFPMLNANYNLPKWMQALPVDSDIIKEIVDRVKCSSQNVCKMCDYSHLLNAFEKSDNVAEVNLNELNLGCGSSEINIKVNDDLFYKVISEQCGEHIGDDYDLIGYINGVSECKTKYNKIKDALSQAEQSGYGVVLPSVDELELEKPSLIKQGGRFGVKLKAQAPSLHIIKVDVSSEVAPTVGSEKQGQDMVDYISAKYEENPKNIWATDMFGKSLHEMIDEGMKDKMKGIPDDTQKKVRKTLTKMVNENKGGLICIIL